MPTFAKTVGAFTRTFVPPVIPFKVRAMYDQSSGQLANDWPAIQAQNFNTLICSADDAAALAAVRASGGKTWVNVGHWTGSGFDTTDSQALASAANAVATGTVIGFYVADEPAYSSGNVSTVHARSQLLKNAYPDIETIIAYYDAASIHFWQGAVDAFALDIYPSRFSFNGALITQLAAAADAAGLRYYGIVGAFTDGTATYPMPTAAQLQTMCNLWSATNQSGQGCYAWGATAADHLESHSDLLAVLKTWNS